MNNYLHPHIYIDRYIDTYLQPFCLQPWSNFTENEISAARKRSQKRNFIQKTKHPFSFPHYRSPHILIINLHVSCDEMKNSTENQELWNTYLYVRRILQCSQGRRLCCHRYIIGKLCAPYVPNNADWECSISDAESGQTTAFAKRLKDY